MWHFQQAQQSLNFSVQQRNSTASNKRRLLNVYLKLNIIFCLKQAYLHSDWRHQIERSRRRTELGGKSNYGRTSGKNGKFEFYIEKEIVLKSGICYSVQIYPVGSTHSNLTVRPTFRMKESRTDCCAIWMIRQSDWNRRTEPEGSKVPTPEVPNRQQSL